MKQIALTIIALLAASAAWAQDDVYFVPTKKALEAERQEMYGHSSYDQIAIPTDKAFEQFESLEYGLRALMRNAYTWIQRGKNTLEKLITVWAAPHENHTGNYIDYVARQMQIPKNQEFKTLDKKIMEN